MSPRVEGARHVDDEIRVPVKLWLRPESYRALMKVSERTGLDVARLVAECVRRQLSGEAPLIVRPARPTFQRAPLVTDEQRAEIRRLNAAGATDPEIAGEVGIALSTVKRQRAALGIASVKRERPKREWTAEMDDLIRERHGRGVSDAAIGREMRIPQPMVSKRREQLGLRPLFRSPNVRGKREAS